MHEEDRDKVLGDSKGWMGLFAFLIILIALGAAIGIVYIYLKIVIELGG